MANFGHLTSLVFGWLTVFGYFATAALAWVAATGPSAPQWKAARVRSARRFWWATMLIAILLGINRQIDILAWATQVSRSLAADEGWYARRRPIQALALMLLLATALAAGYGMLALLRLAGRWVAMGIAGVVLLLALVAARAVSLHQLDGVLYHQIAGLRLSQMLEWSGIALTAGAAFGFILDARQEGRIARLHGLSGRRHRRPRHRPTISVDSRR